MITFTDRKLYVKGTCMAIASDVSTGQILYYSNKFQTGNINGSVTMGEIRAGMGNSIATIIPSDSNLGVDFTAADFSLWAKSAQVGAPLNYGAPTMVCQVVTADGGKLKIGVENGAPESQYGYTTPKCYIQEVGQGSPIATGGIPYDISEDGTVPDFSATNGTSYKVWYFVNRSNALVASIRSVFDPKVVHFSAQLPVYSNDGSAAMNEGTRCAWLYVIIPRLKLGGNPGIVGDQSTADTTSLSGQAVSYDEDTVSGTCSDCNAGNLAYYVYVPDDPDDGVVGLAVVGGNVRVVAGANVQIPVKLVMRDGSLTNGAYSNMTFTTSGTLPTGTTVSETGEVKAGTAAGDFDVTVGYPATDTKYTAEVPVSIVAD